MSDKLHEIKESLNSATSGPWKVYETIHDVNLPLTNERYIGTEYDHPQLGAPDSIVTLSYGVKEPKTRLFISVENANLIANAPQYISWLIEQLEQAQSTSAFLEARKKWEQEQESYLEKIEHDRQAISELTHKLNAVNQALTDAKGEPSETSEELIAWLYSTLPFLEEE